MAKKKPRIKDKTTEQKNETRQDKDGGQHKTTEREQNKARQRGEKDSYPSSK